MPSSLNALIERNKAIGRLRDRIDACLELSIRLALAGQAINKDPLIVRILGDICEQEIETMLAVEAERIDLNIDAQISLGMARIISAAARASMPALSWCCAAPAMCARDTRSSADANPGCFPPAMSASPSERSERARNARRHYVQSGEAYAECVAECDALITDLEGPSDG